MRAPPRVLATIVLLAAWFVSCGRAPEPDAQSPPPSTPAAQATARTPTTESSERMAPSDPRALAARVFQDSGSTRPAVQAPSTLQGRLGSFLVYGDTRSNPQIHKQVIARMCQEPGIAFACHTGDLVGDGSKPSEWTTFLKIIGPLAGTMPFYPVLGNHDLPREMALQAFGQLRDLPRTLPGAGYYYGVDCGPVALAFLDSESLIKGDRAQLEWAARWLAASHAGLKAMLLHRPLWSPGPNGGNAGLRKTLLPIAQATGVRLLFHGHDHMYYRTVREGLVEIITAGGGAPLYEAGKGDPTIAGDVLVKTHHYVRIDVGSDRCVISAIDLTGTVIDRFELPVGGVAQSSRSGGL